MGEQGHLKVPHLILKSHEEFGWEIEGGKGKKINLTVLREGQPRGHILIFS